MNRETTTDYAVATYTGQGEFYSGIHTGERVTLRRERIDYDHAGDRKHAVHFSVQSLEDPGAWLTVQTTAAELTDITEFSARPPFEYGYNVAGKAPSIVGISDAVRALELVRQSLTAKLRPLSSGRTRVIEVSYRRLDGGASNAWRVVYVVTGRRLDDGSVSVTPNRPDGFYARVAVH